MRKSKNWQKKNNNQSIKAPLWWIGGLLLFILCSCQKYPDISDTVFEENTLKIAVIGDWGREGILEQRLVAHQLDRVADLAKLDFILATGDNFYENGVKSTTDSAWLKSYTNIYKSPQQWFVALGNHDYQGNTQAQIDYSKLNPKWQMPERYFTFSKKIDNQTSARFVFIDSTPLISTYFTDPVMSADILQQNPSKQLKWIDSVLANSNEKYKIVVGHHPLFSMGDTHGDSPELIQKLKPLFDKYKVNIYLAGHEHCLQYLKVDNSPTHYIVSGGGSEARSVSWIRYPAQFAQARLGFSMIEIKPNTILGRFIDEKGQILWEKDLEL